MAHTPKFLRIKAKRLYIWRYKWDKKHPDWEKPTQEQKKRMQFQRSARMARAVEFCFLGPYELR